MYMVWLQLSQHKEMKMFSTMATCKTSAWKISYTMHKTAKPSNVRKRMQSFGTDAHGCTQHDDMAGLPSRRWCTWHLMSRSDTSRHACTKAMPYKSNAHGRAPATANALRLAMGKIGKKCASRQNLNNKFNKLNLTTDVIGLNSSKFKLMWS